MQAAVRTTLTILFAVVLLVVVGWLTGCATLATDAASVRTVTVPCVRASDIPTRPILFSEQAWASSDVFVRARALLADRLRLISHVDRLESTLRACAE